MSLLEVRLVSKAFGGIQALQDCSLSVEKGTITGLIGPNGSGKTTLFNTITAHERANVGEILFDGRPITKLSPAEIFGLGIGRTFQLTRIFPRLSVLENMHIALPRSLRGLLRHWGDDSEQAHALTLLDTVGLTHLRDEPAGTLSYGQKKLLEFALLLVARPRMILLDEPAGGVNPTMINELASIIRRLNQEDQITFLVVEHNMEFVMTLCNTVNVMHRGAIIAAGPPTQVRENAAVLEAYLGV